MRQPTPAEPDRDAPLTAVSVALVLAVPALLVVASSPGVVAVGAALVAVGYLLARVRDAAVDRTHRTRRRIRLPGTTVCVDL